MTLFLFLAALMLAAALLFVLVPLMRRRAGAPGGNDAKRLLEALNAARDSGILSEDEYAAKRAQIAERMLGAIDAPAAKPRAGLPIALAVALLLPAGAILLYRLVGQPAAIDGVPTAADDQAPGDHGQNMEQAIVKLAEKMKQNPDDAEGWALLGRAYEATQHFNEARDALKHAVDLAPQDPDVMVSYAEALALSGATHSIDGEPRQIIESALKAAPDNQRGLWLLGIADYQQKKFDAAIATWKHLLGVLPKDSDIAKSVLNEIAQAEAERDGKAPPPELADNDTETPDATPAPESATSGAHLTVQVELDAKLKAKAAPGDILFVFAKAASGPPMPLAIQRLTAGQLPLSVTLTDGMGMLPNLKLSQFPQVVIGARISKSGNAIAQSGDLQTLTQPLAVTTTAPIKLTIDQIVP